MLPVRDDFNKRASSISVLASLLPDEDGMIRPSSRLTSLVVRIFEPLDVNGDVAAQRLLRLSSSLRARRLTSQPSM